MIKKDVKAQIIVSESVQNIPTGMRQDTNITNPFIGLFLPYVPSAATFGITVILYFDKPFEGVKIEVALKQESTGTTLFTTGASTIDGAVGLDATKSNISLNVDLRNIGIPDEGQYTIYCLVNDEVIGQHDFYVYKIEKQKSKND